ncbi:LOW QUALITY PROTEIN: hypothetical protein Cgig2_010123 [Carnegiea gigantea]|uniref:Reverse transcriptase zinc-binding domain-containing protein n=1 Tax=Carnegiea gigantea TaxID=171969 RepID=A0A9Q1JQG4_9CARY|nr:LOW QUALITY PROTEIN: hypothetical protein Cgig2_010123 [Carnegiea gigantea]
MWLTNPSCKDTINLPWVSSSHSGGLLYRPDGYTEQLIKWNAITFGHVVSEIRKLENHLKQKKHAVSKRNKGVKEKGGDTLVQRACLDYLKYGDANTRWFNSHAIMRKAENSIVGFSLNIWQDRRIPRLTTFKPIIPPNPLYAQYKVIDLIDYVNGRWHESLVNHIFLPYDAELILNIPLCDSWPSDKLIWHYHPHGTFTIHSLYHMLIADVFSNATLPSSHTIELWHSIWSYNIPPQIRLFGWWACPGILPTSVNLSA